jgi:hypothetical protein
MNSIVKYCLILFLFSACAQEETSQVPDTDVVDTNSTELPSDIVLDSAELDTNDEFLANGDSSWLQGYYLFDDNWGEAENESEIEKYASEKFRKFLKWSKGKPNEKSIFGHQSGAGPNNIQWNPETDLICIGRVSNERLEIPKRVTWRIFNGEVNKSVTWEVSPHGNYFHFYIQREYWQKLQRKVTMENIDRVYSDIPEQLQEWKMGLAGEGEYYGFDMLLGQYIELNVMVEYDDGGIVEFSEILHTLYGE